ncbi:MAG: hypothetical protein CMF58_07990 [Lentimicrobiaceae bacterium]|jgi:periplasmic mercuric ion binding protein|nr:hypothetical protein [Lentimicrobiaceae bacterium]MDG1902235.1 hypothetical protein [Bacteroidales bacterium]MDG2080197.1 hypothetical protein [Bacteroidales bacterium]|tara:strand:+ start:9997 stop:10359 length:363 start_codon:yes stop_codon:yes gene_type:complete
MKSRIIILTITAMFLLMGLQSQETEKKEKQLITVEIQTSAVCGMCKEKLEHDLAFEKGVKYVNLDNETKIITIKFKEGKNTKEKIKIAITKVGYDADDIVANQKAHDNLPKCCQKGTPNH